MQLAINYSPAAAGLVQSGKIHIDYIKTPDWEWMIKEARATRPAAVHFTLEAGNGMLDGVDWQAVNRIALDTQTPYVNLHLDCRGKYHPGIPANSTDPAQNELLLRQMLEDVWIAVHQFGAERVIVENSPYRSEEGKTLRACVVPGTINKVVEDTGCGFLLDISHAIIAAHYLGMDYQEYFYQLPLNRIKEMHFAGIHKIDGLLTDHLSIQEQDWYVLDWVLGHIKSGEWSHPWLLAFEYGGVGETFSWRSDPRVIAEQVPMLYGRIQGMGE